MNTLMNLTIFLFLFFYAGISFASAGTKDLRPTTTHLRQDSSMEYNEKKMASTIEEMRIRHKHIRQMDASMRQQLAALYRKFDELSKIFSNINCAEKKVALKSLELELDALENKTDDNQYRQQLLTIKNNIAKQINTECKEEKR